jgi:hypothetical protein
VNYKIRQVDSGSSQQPSLKFDRDNIDTTVSTQFLEDAVRTALNNCSPGYSGSFYQKSDIQADSHIMRRKVSFAN